MQTCCLLGSLSILNLCSLRTLKLELEQSWSLLLSPCGLMSSPLLLRPFFVRMRGAMEGCGKMSANVLSPYLEPLSHPSPFYSHHLIIFS